MSVFSPTLKAVAAVVLVVVDVVAALFFEPQAVATTSEHEEQRDQGLQRGLREVLDCGTKTVADSTSHTVLGVALRARGGQLEVLLAAGGELPESRVWRRGSRSLRRLRGRSTSTRSRTSNNSKRGCCAADRSRRRISVSPRRMRPSTATGASSLRCRPIMPSSSRLRRCGSARSSRTRTSVSRSRPRRSRSRSCA